MASINGHQLKFVPQKSQSGKEATPDYDTVHGFDFLKREQSMDQIQYKFLVIPELVWLSLSRHSYSRQVS